MLPREENCQPIDSLEVSVNLIPKMMNELWASLVISAVQLAVCAPVRCDARVCRYGQFPRSQRLTTLYVEQASHRVGLNYQVTRGTAIPQPHQFGMHGSQELGEPPRLSFHFGVDDQYLAD